MNKPRTLNQYTGTDPQGNGITIVAADMETACKVYKSQQESDPVQMQRTKQNIMCVLPENIVTFTAEAYAASGVATGCSVVPGTYTLIAGSKQIFTATAGEGFEFLKWQIDGVDVTDDSGAVIADAVAILTIPSGKNACTIRGIFGIKE
jgi:hypothetical protein